MANELRTDTDIEDLFRHLDKMDQTLINECDQQWEQDIQDDPAGAGAWTAFVKACKQDLDRIDLQLRASEPPNLAPDLFDPPAPGGCEFSVKARRTHTKDGRLRKFLDGDVPYWIAEGQVDKWP